MRTAQINIQANKRAPFDDEIVLMGLDYSAAVFAMEIRNEPGDQGAPLISLGASVAGGEGISCTYDPGYADPEGGDPGASLIRIRVNETTLEGLPYSSDPAKAESFAYDLHVTPDGGKKFVFCAGAFMVLPGVTL